VSQRLITISVVSHEHGDDIPNLLADLAAFGPQTISEVIVTLNVPEAELSDWIEAHDWPFKVNLIHNSNPMGYGANHNQAFARCGTPYFCVVNPDIRLTRDPFPRLIDALDNPLAGCSYPLQSNGHGVPRDFARAVPTPVALLRRYLLPSSVLRPQPHHWINGAFMLFRSKTFSVIGGFDANYFMYCEDVEICLRLHLIGLQIFPVPQAVVLHAAQHASRRHFKHFRWHIGSLWRLWNSRAYREFLNAISGGEKVPKAEERLQSVDELSHARMSSSEAFVRSQIND
jgi:GT2 family glycosyltransferase